MTPILFKALADLVGDMPHTVNVSNIFIFHNSILQIIKSQVFIYEKNISIPIPISISPPMILAKLASLVPNLIPSLSPA